MEMMLPKNIYYRRKILLRLISAFGSKGVEKIKLQKLLFLFCEEQKKKQANPAFYFFPYKFGSYSRQADKDLMVLTNHYQLLTLNENKWHIKINLNAINLNDKENQIADWVLDSFATWEYQKITSYIYDRYPYFSIRSEWQMTQTQKIAANEQKDVIDKKNSDTLFTVGYEGKTIDAYLNELVENNISLLCDVRRNPLSMKYGFSKNRLREYCENIDVEYVHIPRLGIASAKRQGLTTQKSYDTLFAEYSKQLPQHKDSLMEVVNHFKEQKRIVLTCFEADPLCCHRHCISEYLTETKQIKCEHL